MIIVLTSMETITLFSHFVLDTLHFLPHKFENKHFCSILRYENNLFITRMHDRKWDFEIASNGHHTKKIQHATFLCHSKHYIHKPLDKNGTPRQRIAQDETWTRYNFISFHVGFLSTSKIFKDLTSASSKPRMMPKRGQNRGFTMGALPLEWIPPPGLDLWNENCCKTWEWKILATNWKNEWATDSWSTVFWPTLENTKCRKLRLVDYQQRTDVIINLFKQHEQGKK